ncbi:non-ribosomal peptide synthetase [Tahibacter amnicola]|uniref:Amino acid adenylation domain-containing protein n=1 Tax=Tahibacter amnicola TaxID=2976241 RepID=A0ABY6BAU3_9GAMM|nr:non-ribosomal peptide synthetase [Tahibacter amnicola]UXI66268.1 amino acid adenylation domain-containing protein [Tahibacter amnicola]
MDLNALLATLRDRRIRLIADGEKLRYEAPPGAVDAPLLAGLKANKSALLSLMADGSAATASPALVARSDRHAPRPLTWQQEALWFAERREGGCRALHLPMVVRFERAPDAARLEAAMRQVMQRHAELRSVFVESPSGWVRQSLPVESFSLACVPRGGVLSVDDAPLVADLGAFVDAPFDLTRAPPLRARLVLGDTDAVLCLVVHHTAADAVAVGIVLAELSAAYQGTVLPGSDVACDYGDFALWQRQARNAEQAREQAQSYVQRLGAVPPLHTLSTDHPRGAVRGHRSGRVIRFLPESQLAALEHLAGQCGATLFMALQTVYGLLLRRHSEDAAIVIGVPFANRILPGSERIVGTFVNLLPLRLDVTLGDTFLGLLGKVREFNTDIHGFQATPFERLVEHLGAPRDASHHPLFQLTLGLQPGAARLALGGEVGKPWELDRAVSQFDLGLDITRDSGTVRARWEFDAGLFERDTIERWADQFGQLLCEVVAAPTRVLAQLYGDVAVSADAAADAIRETLPLGTQFETVAAAHPVLPALVVGEARLDFAELDRRAALLARWLCGEGVTPGAFVAISTTPVVETYVALLAIVKAGAAYVPLDPASPAERIGSMLDDASPALILADAALRAHLPATPIRVVDAADALFEAEKGTSGGATPVPVTAPCSHPAYAIFTSGSTGQPKGVVVSHAAVARLAGAESWLRLTPGQHCLQSATLAFDAATYELWSTWLQGACVVVAGRDTLLNPVALEALIHNERIDAAFFTTALFNRLAVASPGVFAKLGTVLFGGEAVTNACVATAVQACPQTRFVHVYGPTENTTFSSGHEVSRADAVGVRPIPIGRVLRTDVARILDAQGQPVPVGATGELHVGGPGLALGYLGRGARTAVAFVPDPSGKPGDRLYRTGDLVRRLADGAMEFIGRQDAQVKINGYRIELEEIESVIRTMEGVVQCRVAVRPDMSGSRCICGYVVAAAGSTLDAATVRSRAAAALPGYMRPQHVWVVPELPLNPNGKVDWSQLPDPSAATVPVSVVQTWTTTEREIAAIWRDIAGVHAQTPDTDFFVAGGDSLRAMAVWHAVQARWGAHLALKAFFVEPTVGATARAIRSGVDSPVDVQRQEAVGDGIWPMSPLQQDLFYEALLAPDSSAYAISLIADVEGPLRRDALHRAGQRLAERHLALRCTYAEEDGEFIQRLCNADVPVRFDAVGGDLSREAWERQGTAQSFDLETETPLRIRVLQDGDGHAIQLIIHHIACDALSLPTLMADLRSDYVALCAGNALPPVIPDTGYFAHARRQGAFVGSTAFEAALSAWREELASYATPPHLGAPDDPAAGTTLCAVPVVFTAGECAQLDRVSAAAGCSRFEWLLASWFRACSEVFECDDLVITTTCSGRTRPEDATTIGYFVNLLPIRNNACRAAPAIATLALTRERLRAALSRQDVPYSYVRRLLPRTGSGAAVPINFTYVGQAMSAGDWGDLVVTRVRGQAVEAKCAINLQLAASGDALAGTVQFMPSHTGRARMQELAARWRSICLAGLDAVAVRRPEEVVG